MLFLLRVKGTGEQRETQTEESDMACNHKMSIDYLCPWGFEQDSIA